MGDTRATAVLHGGQQLQVDTTETSTPHFTELPSLKLPGYAGNAQVDDKDYASLLVDTEAALDILNPYETFQQFPLKDSRDLSNNQRIFLSNLRSF